MKSLPWLLAGIIILTVVAGWLRLTNLGAINFYNDEYYQFETAVGWLKTGEYRRFDFYSNQVGDLYTRAELFTWQVAQSMRWFGINEAAARLPAVWWGIILIPLTIGGIWLTTKQPWLALAVGGLITVDDFFVGTSRYVRMYSMVFVLTIIIVCAVYQWFVTKRWQARLVYTIVIGLATIVYGLIFKEFMLALWAGISLYIGSRGLLWLWQRRLEDKLYAVMTGLGIILAVAMISIHLAGYHIIPVKAFIIRDHPHWEYLTDVFTAWQVPVLAMIAAVIGLITLRRWRSWPALVAVIAVSLLAYFVWFSNRWDTKRYIGFIIPLWYVLTVLGFIEAGKLCLRLFGKYLSKTSRIILLFAIVLLLGPWLSFPGIPAQPILLQPAYADRSYTELGLADDRTAYQFVIDHYQPGEVVLIQGPRFFYWTDTGIPVYKLGAYEHLTFVEFMALAKQSQTGGWMIYNFTHGRHLRQSIKDYADKHFQRFDELNNTLVHIYHFTPADLTYPK